MHRAYVIPVNAENERFRKAEFPTLIASIPSVKREDGTDYYVGGLVEVKDGHRIAKAVPTGVEMEF